MELSLDIEWRTFETFYALDSFGDYWVENEALIQKAADEEEARFGPKWSPEDEEQLAEYRMELRNARHLHDEVMAPMFRYSCIVLLYTIVERELRRLVENLENERGQQKLRVNDIRESSFLGQVAKFTEAFFELHLAACPQYQAICDLQKIRDCIVHCRGEVRPSRDKAYLIKLKDCRPGFFASEGSDIEIGAECIEQFIREAWATFAWLFAELKWQMDASWKERKWAMLPSSPIPVPARP
jgi:hypothetical protein